MRIAPYVPKGYIVWTLPLPNDFSPRFYRDLGGRLMSTESFGDERNLIFDGRAGIIFAKNLELGGGAKITDKIIFSKKEDDSV
jgi:hypothetical protein